LITRENLLSHEIIGLNAITLDSGPYSGLSGLIVMETKNMITLRCGNILKNLPKSCINLRMIIPSGVCFISGSSLLGRPEDRVKRNNLG
jgi:ribonuclease P protein subunit POP4